MTTRAARAAFGAWIVVITAFYYAFPNAHLLTWALLGYSSVAVILLGVRLNKPERRLPWYLLAAGLACFVTGDSLYNFIVWTGHEPRFPGPADVLYLLVYPLVTGAFLLFVRARGGANRAALLDALVPTVGLGLLSWVYWIAPFTRSHELSFLEKAVSIGYPLGDVLALAMTLRMLTSPGRRPRALTAVTIAMVGLLISDIFYGQSQLNSAWSLGGPVDLGWIVFYAVMGWTALMPSMRDLTAKLPQQLGAELGTSRIVWMATAALVAPAILYVEWMNGHQVEELRGGVVDAPVIAAAAALMFLLVLARVNGLADSQRRARARERALHQAAAELFAATTVEQAATAVRDGITTMMPADSSFKFTLSCDADVPHQPGLRLVTAAEVPPGLVTGDFQHFLYATMPLPGDGRVAAGLLAGSGPVLRELMPSVEAFLGQIEVVMQRIGLSREVSRRDSEAYFRTLIQNASDVILIVDGDDRITYASPSADTVLGHPDLTGASLESLIALSHHSALHDALAAIRAGRDQAEAADLALLCADGRLLQVECTGRDLREDPTVRGLVLTIRDVTDQRRLEDDLSHLAFHDGLTGLANRVLFRNRLEQSFAVAGRDDATIAVLFVDLDDFKDVNDTLGHAVGDQLLVSVGERIASIIGVADTAARMGGDEFAILIEQSQDASRAELMAAEIVRALAVPVEVSDGIGGTHNVSGAASVGVATNRDAESATELLRHADLALYQAKGDDKGTWQRYRSELHTAMVQRLETRTALHEAIDGEQFAVMYQPIVDLTTRETAGVEALVRWQHPVRGLLGPYHFIEVAEESGAIVEIGRWVLRAALTEFTRMRAGTTLKYVSVNVSARQFRTPGFVDQVRDALEDSGARPEWLLLEITESLLLRDADQVWQDLGELRALGVRIAIDDFGTGYSSLSYLRQMPVDVLKVDKSFIDDILGSEQQRALVDAIVTLARNFDLAVVAEGIEDEGQRAELAAMGCPYGQGFLFSKPVWPHEISARPQPGVMSPAA
ncbi:EAL domain-containing protein [Actinoplanes sp. Pm04-4]|uniref:EAL domain-containing protein n=1 Tax=Paractinoplanes pyxinae TaxID=2997416 RepID=A0ABT4BBT2_9ACTN|nr:EAL domain-containing protein [Actinoplanes pyxinae]MCY1143457.1 EAL domain-containing protein [Actinoplanes pyxinae]